MTFLNNWFAADARGTSLTYASAVAVEEKSVIDYNLGNPDGVLSPGEEPRVPASPARGDLPGGGHALLRQPVHHPRHRVGRRRREGGRRAVRGRTCSARRTSRRCSSSGSGRTTPRSPLGDPIVAANGVDPDQPTAELEVPAPDVLVGILDSWAELRKDARVLLVLDVSGSMGDPARRRQDQARPRQGGGGRAPSTSSRTPTRSGCGCSPPTSAAPTRTCATSCRSARSATSRERARRSRSRPSSRRTARRCTTSPSKAYESMLDDVRPGEDQRRRAAHRRRERRRRPRRRRAAVRRADPDAAGRQRGSSVAAGAALHDLLRRGRRRRSRCGRSPRPPAPPRTTPATRRPSTRCSPPSSPTSDGRWRDARFRDRFFTQARRRGDHVAARHPAAGAGTAAGIVAGLPVVAAAGVGVAGLGWAGAGRGAAARRRRRGSSPSSLSEPWRSYGVQAEDAKRRFDQVVASVPAGPLRERLSSCRAASTTASTSRGASPAAATRSSTRSARSTRCRRRPSSPSSAAGSARDAAVAGAGADDRGPGGAARVGPPARGAGRAAAATGCACSTPASTSSSPAPSRSASASGDTDVLGDDVDGLVSELESAAHRDGGDRRGRRDARPRSPEPDR